MNDINQSFVEKLIPFVLALRAYHRHEVENINSIPKKGNTLLVVNHSLATYDIALLFHAILAEQNRLCRPLVDRLFYKIPIVGDLINSLGGTMGSPDAAKNMLLSNEIVAVAPGGMQEALRPPEDKYKIMWESRKGFAKLSIETGAPIVIAVCPNADNMYDLIPNKLTNWAYKKFKVPVFFAKGLGRTPLPKPVKLIHTLSQPIKPPKKAITDEAYKKQVDRYHKKLVKIANELIENSVEKHIQNTSKFLK